MRVFVSVGTDHHPFDRLLTWIERWAEQHPADLVVVQHGVGPAPAGTEAHGMLTKEQMEHQISGADVVVVSAGPGAVMTSRSQGRRPVAVARHAGEAIDDHQRSFSSLLNERGLAWAADDETTLGLLLERARTRPEEFRCDPPLPAVETTDRFAAVIDRVLRP